MLTKEEELHKDEIMRLTEDVLDAKGIECDASISKISEEDLREILELVRKNRKKKKNKENHGRDLIFRRRGGRITGTFTEDNILAELQSKRLLLIVGIATLCFGISLFVLRIPVQTIVVFFIIGIPVVAIWWYADKESKPKKSDRYSQEACICPICKHDQAKICLQQKCACSIVMKADIVVGHSVNPLQ